MNMNVNHNINRDDLDGIGVKHEFNVDEASIERIKVAIIDTVVQATGVVLAATLMYKFADAAFTALTPIRGFAR